MSAADGRLGPDDDPELFAELERSKALGFLGPGPVADHVAHAEGLRRLIDTLVEAGVGSSPIGTGAVRRGLDLGTGGGVPGLVLARQLADWTWVLLDSQERRTAFLADATTRLGLGPRVSVHRARAEDAARDVTLRGLIDVVVARSFGPPAVTAECGGSFLPIGGLLLVSEPPEPVPSRWPADGLASLGLRHRSESLGSGWAVLERVAPCPEDCPRRSGRPSKRPLWT